jgi:hypothetical protein
MADRDEFIERRIITGLIVSTEYVREIRKMWSFDYLESPTAKLLAGWCIDHFDKYGESPGRDIEGIYSEKLLGEGIPKDRAEDIEGILEGLSEEYERGHFNFAYLLDQSRAYFREQKLKRHVDAIHAKLSLGSLTDAEQVANSYASHQIEDEYKAIDPFASAERVRKAFEERSVPLIKFPKVLGEFWNDQLARDSLVALMGPEKRGKTFLLIEMAIRAIRSKCNVAFFQAGDMTENQQLRRLYIYLSEKSDMKKYCNGLWIPVLDCLYNQLNSCRSKDREQNRAILDDEDQKLKLSDLILLYLTHKNHKPCHNCKDIKGTVWVKYREPESPLLWKDAFKKGREWRKQNDHRFKLCTCPNETLTITEINSLLNIWEHQEGFVPDVIVIDYADILAPDPDCSRLDFRHQQNKIWQRLRKLSQEKHCLVITATQASATSYKKDSLSLDDFSEDKRKYAHVTAMYGLNQTIDEKRIGLMRISPLVVREDDFITSDEVKILQRLQIGKPFLGSYR